MQNPHQCAGVISIESENSFGYDSKIKLEYKLDHFNSGSILDYESDEDKLNEKEFEEFPLNLKKQAQPSRLHALLNKQ